MITFHGIQIQTFMPLEIISTLLIIETFNLTYNFFFFLFLFLFRIENNIKKYKFRGQFRLIVSFLIEYNVCKL